MDKIKKIISETFSIPADTVDENLLFRNLETWDSLNHMVFIVAVEREFDIELTAEEIIKMQSFADIKEIVTGKLQTA